MSMINPGMVIGGDRYEILEKIGSGGMADVFKAKDHRLNRFVAVKILKAEYSGDTSFVAKFRGEAQSCAGLTHPNIVSVFDVGDDGDLHYIVMELIQGITLKRFIERKGKLDVKEAVGIAIQIAQGLDAAHQNHVVHRDIKPQNILISREGKVKVADFGIAKAATTNTVNQSPVGSVHYLSPEQARGGYSDERSDIYSLGVTIYEMLAGRVPFTGDSSVSVALLHIQGEATPLSELNPDVSPALEKIVQKCMQKKPERRYMTAGELISDLKAAIVNPNGNFVKMNPVVVTDSPTRQMTPEELAQIKSTPKDKLIFEEEDAEEEPAPAVKKASKKDELDDDDDDLDDVSSKVEKFYIIGTVIIVLILVACILLVLKQSGLLSSNEGNYKNSPTPTQGISATPTPETETAIMPDILGYDLDNAEAKIKAAIGDKNLSYTFEPQEAAEYDDTNTYPYGTVMEQNPASGMELYDGVTIKITYSIGYSRVVLEEDIIGMTTDDLEKRYPDLNFKYHWEENTTSTEIDEDCIIRTEPEIGEEIETGSKVDVYLCDGNTRTVVDVVGKSEEDAVEELEDAGFSVKTKTEYSATVEAGTVISQDVAGDTKAKKGTKITIVVSDGPEPTSTPTPTPTPTAAPTATPEPAATDTPTPTPESTAEDNTAEE